MKHPDRQGFQNAICKGVFFQSRISSQWNMIYALLSCFRGLCSCIQTPSHICRIHATSVILGYLLYFPQLLFSKTFHFTNYLYVFEDSMETLYFARLLKCHDRLLAQPICWVPSGWLRTQNKTGRCQILDWVQAVEGYLILTNISFTSIAWNIFKETRKSEKQGRSHNVLDWVMFAQMQLHFTISDIFWEWFENKKNKKQKISSLYLYVLLFYFFYMAIFSSLTSICISMPCYFLVHQKDLY